MLVSFTLTPMMSSLLLKRSSARPGEEEHSSRETGFFHSLSARYGRLLAWSSTIESPCYFRTGHFRDGNPLNSRVGRDWIRQTIRMN